MDEFQKFLDKNFTDSGKVFSEKEVLILINDLISNNDTYCWEDQDLIDWFNIKK